MIINCSCECPWLRKCVFESLHHFFSKSFLVFKTLRLIIYVIQQQYYAIINILSPLFLRRKLFQVVYSLWPSSTALAGMAVGTQTCTK